MPMAMDCGRAGRTKGDMLKKETTAEPDLTTAADEN